MLFTDSFLDELVERNDIADVVSGYVRLSKKSGSNMFGLCPFHSEKTPSFSVSPDKQIYHCFGCGKGGGVINFIMEVENLTFPEAVEFLARRANMTLPEKSSDEESRRRERMFALNRDAARFFYEMLASPAGAPGREYMARRGIDSRTATNFGLGFAPDEWNSLERAMKAKGYSDEEMFRAGLLRRGKNGGFYDVFRSRLMFPVIDVRGNVIGFSGRIVGDGEPKYMNSPETAVFDKGRNLFGLNLAKKSKKGYMILAEGNIDVVSLHQAGFDCAVASLGTSLTAEQARLLSRFTGEVIIAYDSDGAGAKAAQRAIGILEKLDVKVKLLRMTDAKDPDEFIRKKGADAFERLISGSENQIDYRLNSIIGKYDLTVDEQKVAFLREATDMVARLNGAVERQVYAMRVAALSGVQNDVVIKEVERQRKAILSRAQRELNTRQSRPEKQIQPEDKELRYEKPESAVAEEGLIRLLYLDPSLAKRAQLPDSEEFSSPALARIYSAVLTRLRENRAVTAAALSSELSPQEMSLLVKIQQKPETLSSGEKALNDYIQRIHDTNEQSRGEVDLRALADKLKKTKGYGG